MLLMANSHVSQQVSIGLKGTFSFRVANAASSGSHLPTMFMQGLITSRVAVKADIDLWRPSRLVPEMVKVVGPMRPVRRLWFYPGGHNHLQCTARLDLTLQQNTQELVHALSRPASNKWPQK